MNDTPAPAAMPAQLPGVEGMSQEQAAAEYRRYAVSPEFQQANSSPHGKAPALARLEALAKLAFTPPGLQASPAPQTPPISPQQHIDRQHQQSAAEAGQAAPLTEAEIQEMAQLYAPQSAHDYELALPGEEWAELRQDLFRDQVSKSAANLLMHGSGLIEKTLALADADYYAKTDAARDTVRGMPGGARIWRNAFGMVEALPADHVYRPFAEFALTLPGGVIELSAWADRLRARPA